MAAPNTNFSALAAAREAWVDPEPDYDALLTDHLGGLAGSAAVAVNRNDALTRLTGLATRSPVAVSFMLQGDVEHAPSRDHLSRWHVCCSQCIHN